MEAIMVMGAFAVIGGMVVLPVTVIRAYLRERRRSWLDRPLWWWSKRDAATPRMLLNGGIFISGRSGVGKTSAAGRVIAKSLIAHRRIGGCVFAAKPQEDLAMWRGYSASAGRRLDVLGPGHPVKVNVFDYLARHRVGNRGLVSFIRGVGETLHRGGGGSSAEHGQFFEAGEDELLSQAITIVRLALGRVTSHSLARFIEEHADQPGRLSDPGWRKGFHAQLVTQASENAKTPAERTAFANAERYFLLQVPAMPDKTFGCVKMGVLQTLSCFNSPDVQDAICGETNFDLDHVVDGWRWLFVDASPLALGPDGACISNAIKAAIQTRIMQRPPTAETGICTLWCDEAALFATRRLDPAFLATCRSRNGCLVYLAQGRASLVEAFGGESGRHAAQALFNNFSHHLALTVGCSEDAEALSNLLGRRVTLRYGASIGPPESMFDTLFGPTDVTTTVNQVVEPVLEPRVFLSGLRSGGPANRGLVDAIVVRTGESFSTGENFLFTTFRQGK